MRTHARDVRDERGRRQKGSNTGEIIIITIMIRRTRESRKPVVVTRAKDRPPPRINAPRRAAFCSKSKKHSSPISVKSAVAASQQPSATAILTAASHFFVFAVSLITVRPRRVQKIANRASKCSSRYPEGKERGRGRGRKEKLERTTDNDVTGGGKFNGRRHRYAAVRTITISDRG